MAGARAATLAFSAAAALAVLCALPGVEAEAVELENGYDFFHGNITARDERLKTCGSYCTAHCSSSACPFNVASYTNVMLHGGGLDERISVISSTIGAPSAIVGYCGLQAKCELSFRDSRSSDNFWVKVGQNYEDWKTHTPGQPFTQNMDLLRFAEKNETTHDVFALAIQFDELLEFVDRNHDSTYSPGVDEVVHRVHLGRVAFRPGNLTSFVGRDVDGNAVKVYAYNVTSDTAEGHISFRFEMSSFPDAPGNPVPSLADPQIRTPNSSRVVLGVYNFTFHNPQSRLAVKAFLVLPSHASTALELVGRQVLAVDRESHHNVGYFSWTPTALVDAGTGSAAGDGLQAQRVRATPLEEAFTDEMSYSLARAVKNGEYDSEARVTYFTFGGGSYNPRAAYWDIAVGVGDPPRRAYTDYWAGAVIVTLVIAFVALLVINSFAREKVAGDDAAVAGDGGGGSLGGGDEEDDSSAARGRLLAGTRLRRADGAGAGAAASGMRDDDDDEEEEEEEDEEEGKREV